MVVGVVDSKQVCGYVGYEREEGIGLSHEVSKHLNPRYYPLIIINNIVYPTLALQYAAFTPKLTDIVDISAEVDLGEDTKAALIVVALPELIICLECIDGDTPVIACSTV